MSRTVIWSPEARADLEAISAYLSAEAPDQASRVVNRLEEATQALGRAQIGRPGRMTGTYEKSVSGIHYIIAYFVDRSVGDGPVLVLRIIHAARDWKRNTWPK